MDEKIKDWLLDHKLETVDTKGDNHSHAADAEVNLALQALRDKVEQQLKSLDKVLSMSSYLKVAAKEWARLSEEYENKEEFRERWKNWKNTNKIKIQKDPAEQETREVPIGEAIEEDEKQLEKHGWYSILDRHTLLPRQNFQIQNCKWSDLVAWSKEEIQHPPRRVLYDFDKDIMLKRGDSGGDFKAEGKEFKKASDIGGSESKPDPRSLIYDPVGYFPVKWDAKKNHLVGVLDEVAAEYLEEVFLADSAPLRKLGEVFDYIDHHYGKTHRVILSLDYYRERPQDAWNLHKDTTGTTLFVGLHYDNEKKMLGPEYVHDLLSHEQSPIPRGKGSPWHTYDKNNEKTWWPKEIIQALEAARGELREGEKDDEMNYSYIEPMGMVYFVDELIFHTTPLAGRRDNFSNQPKAQFEVVRVSGHPTGAEKIMQSHKNRFERRYSQEDIKFQQVTSENNKRSFVRLWAMIEPKVWHVEHDIHME